MVRVLVVEDEPPIKRAIIRGIERRKEFMVAGTAINGRQALELLEQIPVDAVFTDIRMPVMDGLELARHIRARYPEIEVVIISGYQEFAYMHEALVSQVTDYLLKPVDEASLNPVLDKLVQRVAALRLQKKRRELEGAISSPESGGAAGGNAAGCYGVYLVCAGAYPLVEDTLLPARAFWGKTDLEALLSGLLSDEESCMCFVGKSSAEMVAIAELSAPERLREVAETLLERLNKGAELAVTVGASDRTRPIAGIGSALRNIRQRLHTELRLFSPAIIWEEGSSMPDRDGLRARQFERELDDAVRARDKAALGRVLQECVACFVQERAAEIQLVHFLENVLNAHSNLLDTQTANFKLELREAVSNATDTDSLARDITYIFTNSFDRPEESEKGREPALIAQVERYLRENFDKSITNTVLSERFGFVPSYISKLFRIHRGLSPSEYLTRCRIEQAKALMEREPELLFKEVAARIGFSDQYYFSKIFKKETGMWPTEFVKQK